MGLTGQAVPIPAFRGMAYLIGIGAFLPPLVWLVAASEPGVSRQSATLYASTVLGTLLVAVLHHCATWRHERVVDWLARSDHAMIFVLMAGTFTPVCARHCIPNDRAQILVLVWSLAGVGVALGLAGLLDVYGWCLVPYVAVAAIMAGLVSMLEELDGSTGELLFLGLTIQGLGFVAFVTRRPNLFRPFGYLEVWQTAAVVGMATQFLAIQAMVVH